MLSNTEFTSLFVLALCVFAAGCSDDEDGGDNRGATFALTSPSFEDGDKLPEQFTCEGQPFGEGISPELHWTPGPAATKSYALVFLDTSLSEQSPPDEHGYHWAMWDIPKQTTQLPQELSDGQFPVEPEGAEQVSGYSGIPYRFLGPCPSWLDTKMPGAGRSNDSYAFILYALDVEQLEKPEPVTGVKYVHTLDDYLRSNAIGKAELHATSDARPSEVPF